VSKGGFSFLLKFVYRFQSPPPPPKKNRIFRN
jgi:hypothetical protein